MSNVFVCKECKGKGSYKVFNAYDPKAEEEVICEYCDGLGTLTEYEDLKRDNKDDSWVN